MSRHIESNRLRWRAALLSLWLAFAGLSGAPSAAQSVASTMAGTWDLTWHSRSGPRREGYLVVRQTGSNLAAEIHGRGAVTARGTLSGARFDLRGSRMLVPYRIDGQMNGGVIEGTIRVMSVERRFTGVRRPR